MLTAKTVPYLALCGCFGMPLLGPILMLESVIILSLLQSRNESFYCCPSTN